MSAAVEVAAKLPNILVCGTPGTGKTTLAAALAEKLGFSNINIGDMIKDHGFHAGKDSEFDAFILDEASEDKLLDELEPLMAAGGVIIDFHSVDFFPERFFDLVLVLRTDNTTLYDRLHARGYSAKKINENVEAEIFGVVAEEARESYKEEIVQEVQSNSMRDMSDTVDRVVAWLEQWKTEHGGAA